MAVYGRNKEKWNPTKIKSKVSKNNTYDLTSAQGQLWFWLDSERIEGGALYGSYGKVSAAADGIEPIVMDIDDGSATPQLEENTASRFDSKALYFEHGATSFVHSSATGTLKTLDTLVAPERGYDTYISFWIRVPRLNYGTSHGHCFGGLYRNIVGNITTQTFTDLDAAILFNVSSSGAMEFRIQKSGSTSHLFYQSANYVITPDKWAHVTYLIKDVQASDHLTMIQVYINGQRVEMGSPVGIGFDVNADFDAADLEVLLGNSVFGYRDNASTAPGEGFVGNLADFTIMSQPTNGSTAHQDTKAKFIYEATTTGAYHLHSGIHSSSPRLEQLDLDRDSLYPSNFTLENYTMGTYEAPIDRVSSRSESRYTEGYNTADTGYTWTEKASKMFVQSKYQYNGGLSEWEETTTVMPHLRLDPTDTLLTHGNWYSDARSEIFLADRDPTDGFVISSTTAGLATPRTDDELYREHHTTETAQKFVEIDVPEDYKDCFVIDIPLPNDTELQLGTDRQSVHGVTPELSRFDSAGNVVANPIARIANMAYYNFKLGRWEDLDLGTHVTDFDYSLFASAPTDTNFVDQNDVGFSPMTGLVVPASEKLAQKIVPMYGKPTSDFGFPIANKFQASDDQVIDLSKYIDESVILEGWEIKTKVIPKVGWQDQESTFYPGANVAESPYHYGGHGEAAVFFHPKKHVTGFDSKVLVDGSDEYYVGNTIPITTVNGSGEETQPTLTTKGLVTSGITAFLLKKPKITDTDALAEDFFLVDEKKRIRKLTDLDSTSNNQGSWETLSAAVDEKLFDTTYKNHSAGGSVPYMVSDKSAFSSSSATSLIGWLQQVYHNDQHSESIKTRENWTRAGDDLRYRTSEGTPIVDLMKKENTTFVSDLLYDNTSEYDLHVVGNTKVLGQTNEGVPMTNFFIKPEGSVNELGVRKTSSDISKKYVVATNMETSISFGDGTLADHAVSPRYGAGAQKGTAKMPMVNFPTKREGSDAVNQFHIDVPLFDSLEDSSQVVLNPTDQLVLGIQNSVSTAYASQQIVGAGHPAHGSSPNFVRWGRTSLTVPTQDNTTSSPYLRLYVKKTRRDADFNIIADSSNYNANVNRDLGDHANADQFITSNTTIYSGSIADDIIGPTEFEAASSKISVDVALAVNSVAFSPGYETWDALSTLAQDVANWDGHYCFERPHWDSIGDTLKGGGLNFGAFDWLFSAFTEASINTAIQSEGTQGGVDYSTATMSSLGLPKDPITVEWTALNHNVFSYGGPLPARTNDYVTFGSGIPSYHNLLQGFLTRNTTAHRGAVANTAIITNFTVSAGLGGGTIPQRYTNGWHIEECNPNSNPPAPTVEADNPDVSLAGQPLLSTAERRPYTHCGAISAWYCKFKLPHYIDSVPGGAIATLGVEFRTVRIDTDSPPKHTDPEVAYASRDLQVGDAFIFNEDHEIIKIESGKTTNQGKKNQRFVDGQVVFIVAGGGTPTMKPVINMTALTDNGDHINTWHVGGSSGDPSGTVYDPTNPAAGGFMYWSHVWDTIRSILEIQATYNSALAYTISDGDDNEHFAIDFKKDNYLQTALRLQEDSINDQMGFEILGYNLTNGVGPGNIQGLWQEIYYAQGSGGSGSGVTWDSAPVWNYNAIDSNSGVSDTYGGGVGKLFNERGGEIFDASGVAQPVDVTDSTPVGNFVSKMFAAFEESLYFCSDLTSPDTDGARLSVTYPYLPNDYRQPQFSTQEATFTESTGRKIDRKVVFRNSEKSNTVRDILEDPTKIGRAGSFGGLKRQITLIDEENPYWDSIMPLVDIAETVDLSNFTPPVYTDAPYNGMGWLLQTLADKDAKQISNSSVTVKLDNQPSAEYDATNTGAYDYLKVNEEGVTVTFPQVGTIGSVTYDSYPVSNYLHRDFRGIEDFTKFTLRNLVFGFGNGVSGRIQMRPSTSIWEGYNSTSRDISNFTNEIVLDPIRGFRFGLLGYNEKPRYTFSQRHFGHLCDMFEQAVDTKRGNFASNVDVFGSPVTINAINPTNPEVPKLMENTSRYNKETDATITIPYIESNYEAKPNPTNLNSESLRVDVAGSIRTRAALAPGNVAANIRRRG